jgi:aminopeptidase-like protein
VTGGVDWSAVPAPAEAGAELHALIAELLPLPRSLTGDGVRRTFDILERLVPLERTEVATGTAAYDWAMPREWNIREAWLADADGRRIVDFADSTLHVLGYSVPISARLSLEELRPHLFSDPERPDVIPFRTSYHHENWGFCLTHRELERLAEGEYEVVIDSTLEDGHLTYAEAAIPGEEPAEVLISTYVCHPQLANDNLSGVVLAALLARTLRTMSLRLSYRFLFSPATVGPLVWLARNEERLPLVRAGLVASCVGDPGRLTYKRSRRGDAEVDRAVEVVLRDLGGDHELRDFVPLGGDERQFCSPGFDLPVGSLTRSPADEFPGYHSSADDLELVRPEFLADSFGAYLRVVDALEGNQAYLNTNPKGEPQLGRRGLYRTVGGGSFAEAALLWVLNLSDGRNDLLAIARRSGLPFADVREAADRLLEADLLAEPAEERVP